MKLLTRLKLIFLILLGGETMITVYVTLIIRGYKTYQEVPDLLKSSVSAELEALELGELAQ